MRCVNALARRFTALFQINGYLDGINGYRISGFYLWRYVFALILSICISWFYHSLRSSTLTGLCPSISYHGFPQLSACATLRRYETVSWKPGHLRKVHTACAFGALKGSCFRMENGESHLGKWWPSSIENLGHLTGSSPMGIHIIWYHMANGMWPTVLSSGLFFSDWGIPPKNVTLMWKHLEKEGATAGFYFRFMFFWWVLSHPKSGSFCGDSSHS